MLALIESGPLFLRNLRTSWPGALLRAQMSNVSRSTAAAQNALPTKKRRTMLAKTMRSVSSVSLASLGEEGTEVRVALSPRRAPPALAAERLEVPSAAGPG